jgi:hypothetical protein
MSSCQPGIEETDLIEEQVDYWNEGSSIDLQEESRYGTAWYFLSYPRKNR